MTATNKLEWVSYEKIGWGLLQKDGALLLLDLRDINQKEEETQ